jgi:hypothetical protein
MLPSAGGRPPLQPADQEKLNATSMVADDSLSSGMLADTVAAQSHVAKYVHRRIVR